MADRALKQTSALIGVAILLLALPALAVHAWMAVTFPSYLHGSFGQDLVFAFAWCGLLVLAVRWRLLGFLSIPVALVVYLAWLFLMLGEAVSYYLQADTFNARFFAHLNPVNLRAGLDAFPVMIGGGIAVFGVMLVVCVGLLAWLWRNGRRSGDVAEHVLPQQHRLRCGQYGRGLACARGRGGPSRCRRPRCGRRTPRYR